MPALPARALGLSAAIMLFGPAMASAQLLSERISVHGFLTQGYGSTNGEPLIGLKHKASADYHNITLQLYAKLAAADVLVLQLNNQHIGDNALGDSDYRFNVDWAFAAHRFNNGVTLKVGKLPMPRGIYNEIREAGTLLPFYRAPVLSYSEGYQTVTGASVNRSFFTESSWELDASAYAGSWKSNSARYLVAAPATPEMLTSEYDHTLGSQLWLGTPVSGLRFGLAGLGYHSNGTRVSADSITPTSSPTRRAVVISVDGDFERFMVRSEVRHQWYLESETSRRDYYYAQGALKLPYGVSLNVQGEALNRSTYVSKADSTIVPYTASKDVAIGGRLAATTSVVFKLERHWAYGRGLDRYMTATEGTPRVTYTLLSATFAF